MKTPMKGNTNLVYKVRENYLTIRMFNETWKISQLSQEMSQELYRQRTKV